MRLSGGNRSPVAPGADSLGCSLAHRDHADQYYRYIDNSAEARSSPRISVFGWWGKAGQVDEVREIGLSRLKKRDL